MLSRRFFWLIAIITLGGAVLRFEGLGQPSLWLDEILHLALATKARAAPWDAWIFGFGFEVENGALFYAGQLLARTVASGETAVRLAPALAGTLAIPMLALAGRASGGPRTGLAAAVLLALSPFHVHYSREGRVYALIMLAAALLLWLFLRRSRRAGAAIPIAGCVLAAYTGAIAGPLLLAAATAGGLLLVAAWWRPRGTAPAALARAAPIRRQLALVVAPVLGLAVIAGLYLGSPRYDPEPATQRGQTPNVTHALSRQAAARTVTALAISGRDETRLRPLASVWLGLAAFGLLTTARRNPGAGAVLISFLAVGLGATFGALHYLDQWFLVRYVAPAVPVYLLAVAAGVVELGGLAGALVRPLGGAANRVVAAAALLALLLALGLPALATARRESYQKADWRRAAADLAALARPGDTVIVSNEWSEVCLRHYLGPGAGSLRIRNARQKTDTAQQMVAALDSAWLVTGGHHARTDIPSWMRTFHPVFSDPVERLAVTFFPDLRTLVALRAGAPCAACTARFAALGGRLDFDGRDAFFHGAGWHPPEHRPDGASFQWLDGRRAELALPALQAGSSLRLHATTLAYPGAPSQRLVLRLDGRVIAELAPAPGWRTHTVTLPRDLAAGGLHLLTLDLGHAARPRDVRAGSTDGRLLGLAVDSLQVTP